MEIRSDAQDQPGRDEANFNVARVSARTAVVFPVHGILWQWVRFRKQPVMWVPAPENEDEYNMAVSTTAS
jgi:hypothetical protein